MRREDLGGSDGNLRRVAQMPAPAGTKGSGPSWSSPFLERLNSFFDFGAPMEGSTSLPGSPPDYRPTQNFGTSYPPSARRLNVSSDPDLRSRLRRVEEKEEEEGSRSPGRRKRDRDERCLTLMNGPSVVLAPTTDRKWFTFIALLDRRDDPDANHKIKSWCRLPVPREMRGYYWKTVTGAKECLQKNGGFYHVLLSKDSSSEYKIQKDVHRTLPELAFFRKESAQQMLFNILKAYAVMDQGMGYCQSMSYITAVLLLHLEEEEAFWVLCQLIKSYGMSGFFKKGLPSLKLSLYQIDKLIEQQLPKLALHFKQEGVLPLLYASEWFSTLFVYNFPLDVVVRLWDIFLVEGVEYLFKVALAMLTLAESELLMLSFEGIVKFLKDRERNEVELDAEILIRVADSMWCVDKEVLERLEDRYNNPTTSIFRIE